MVQIGRQKAIWFLRPPLIRAPENLDAFMEFYSPPSLELEPAGCRPAHLALRDLELRARIHRADVVAGGQVDAALHHRRASPKSPPMSSSRSETVERTTAAFPPADPNGIYPRGLGRWPDTAQRTERHRRPLTACRRRCMAACGFGDIRGSGEAVRRMQRAGDGHRFCRGCISRVEKGLPFGQRRRILGRDVVD